MPGISERHWVESRVVTPRQPLPSDPRKSSATATPEARINPREAQLSRFLRAVGSVTSRSRTAILIALAVGLMVIGLIAGDFPSYWTSAFTVGAAAVTLVMVFVIQHTQSREQTATQLKLDELIRAFPQADDHLVRVEAAGDEELAHLEERHNAHHRSVRTGDERRESPKG